MKLYSQNKYIISKKHSILKKILICCCLFMMMYSIDPVYSYPDSQTVPQQSQSKKEIWNAYMGRVQKRINEHWRPPAYDGAYSIVVSFYILPSGEIEDFKIKSSSGNLLLDKSAYIAILASSPFESLPAEFSSNKVEIVYSFNNNKKLGS